MFCSACGGRRSVVQSVEDSAIARTVLAAIGLSASCDLHPARVRSGRV